MKYHHIITTLVLVYKTRTITIFVLLNLWIYHSTHWMFIQWLVLFVYSSSSDWWVFDLSANHLWPSHIWLGVFSCYWVSFSLVVFLPCYYTVLSYTTVQLFHIVFIKNIYHYYCFFLYIYSRFMSYCKSNNSNITLTLTIYEIYQAPLRRVTTKWGVTWKCGVTRKGELVNFTSNTRYPQLEMKIVYVWKWVEPIQQNKFIAMLE